MQQFSIVNTEYGAKITALNENLTIFLYASPIRVAHSVMTTFDDFIKDSDVTGFTSSTYRPCRVVNLKRFDTLEEFRNDELPTSDRGTGIEYDFYTKHQSVNEYGTVIYSYETCVMYIAHMLDDTGKFKHILCLNCDYVGYSRTTTKLLKYCYEHTRLNRYLNDLFGDYTDFVKMLHKEGLL